MSGQGQSVTSATVCVAAASRQSTLTVPVTTSSQSKPEITAAASKPCGNSDTTKRVSNKRTSLEIFEMSTVVTTATTSNNNPSINMVPSNTITNNPIKLHTVIPINLPPQPKSTVAVVVAAVKAAAGDKDVKRPRKTAFVGLFQRAMTGLTKPEKTILLESKDAS